MKLDTKEYEAKMKKSIESYENDLKTIRAGRANPAVLDKITVEYYGTPTKIGEAASISVPDARTIMIQPWDRSLLKCIEKAIQASDLGINPQSDGTAIRLSFPPLTEERRKELAKDNYKGKVSPDLDIKYGNDEPNESTTQANAFVAENKVDIIISPTTIGLAAAGQVLKSNSSE